MDIHCPHCGFTIVLTGVRPGQFTPACQRCHERFGLTVPAGDGAAPVVEKRRAAEAGTAVATMAPTSAAATLAPPRAAPADTAAATMAPTAVAREPAAETAPPVAAVPDEPIPSTLGGYQVSKPLGQGGMGAVFLARQVSLDRDVALKVLSPRLAADAGFVARFTREAYAAAQPDPPQRRAGVRHRPGPGPPLLRHGVRRRPVAGRAGDQAGQGRPGHGRRVRGAGGAGAEVRPRPGADPTATSSPTT